jgi:DNA helicase-2/ATP-dependent DNA helicase PcrA
MPATPPFLTDEQLLAANHRGGHARIVAVAGAGKTATLTHYLAKRIRAGAPPQQLLVLMYNRAAQQNFQQRLQLALPGHALPQVRTFHALGLRLYQRLIQEGWLPTVNLTPMAEAAVEIKLKQLLQAHSGETGETLQESVQLAVELLQRVKSDAGDLKEMITQLCDAAGASFLAEVLQQFENWRLAEGLITFDDMLYDPARVFRQQPQSRLLFENRLNEILVDEYQDINPVQHFLLQVLAGQRAQVVVIGDPDQTIYEFRGSSPDFITRTFARDFPSPVTYCLSHTFRFGHSLALIANHLISHNREREPILTVSAPGTPSTRIQTATTNDHGKRIVATIERLCNAGAKPSAMAVLCRLWSYARPVELELLARGIPYRMDGEQSILQCREIRPLWHCLELVSGRIFEHPATRREQALFDLLTIPSCLVPHATLQRIASTWARHITRERIAESLAAVLPPSLSPFQKRNLLQLVDALKALVQPREYAHQLLAYARALDYQKRLRKNALNPTQGKEQATTVEAFLRFLLQLKIASAADLLAYLEQMQNRQSVEPTTDAVTVTTVHRSKGLEWPVVFLPNLAEGHMPYLHGREAEPAGALESERRLLYVALTRAQKQLFITLPDTVSDPASSSVSRFVAEMRIDASCAVGRALDTGASRVVLDQPVGDVLLRYLTTIDSPLQIEVNESAPPPPADWQAGHRVRHAILGSGEIQLRDDRRLHIRFNDGKVRILASDVAAPHLTLET